jgi:hypothetical protein
MRVQGTTSLERTRRFPRKATRWALGAVTTCVAASAAHAQLIRGTVHSAVSVGRVPGAVVLLLDSSLTTHARALTSDSGTFTIAATAVGRFHLKVMRIGFRPTESPEFSLANDTTVDLALTDIPVILPTVTTRDRNDCRLHPDTSAAGLRTFALWDEARTAILAAAITLEQHDYYFTKLLHVRIYDVKDRALRDIGLRETESHGSVPWSSIPATQLEHDGYATEDDSGMTFWAPDLDVLLSDYFTADHCFRLTTRSAPHPGFVGIDFEPAGRPRHVEIRGTLWLDSTSSELRSLHFAFVNLPISAPDTLLGGHVDFARLAGGGWILPSWSIRMPTVTRETVMRSYAVGFGPRNVVSRARSRLTADTIRIQGGELRTVRRGGLDDAILWTRPTGRVRILATRDSGKTSVPAPGVIVRLSGSVYGGMTDVAGYIRFEQVLPGLYLFEASTPLHDAIEAVPDRVAVTVRPNEMGEIAVPLKPLAKAAAEVCGVNDLDRGAGVIAGHVTFGDTAVAKAKVKAEWPGGEVDIESRSDGFYRLCNVPQRKLVLVRASRDSLMVTTTITLESHELARRVDLKMVP